MTSWDYPSCHEANPCSETICRSCGRNRFGTRYGALDDSDWAGVRYAARKVPNPSDETQSKLDKAIMVCESAIANGSGVVMFEPGTDRYVTFDLDVVPWLLECFRVRK